MSFDTYNGPAPWEKRNASNLKKKQVKLSSFNITDKLAPWEENRTSLNNKKADLSIFNTDNGNIPDKKHLIYFNPEGLISTRRHRKYIEKVLKKHLEKKRKVIKKRVVELKIFKSEVLKNNTKKLKNHLENTDVQTFINDAKNDLKLKESILQKDKEYNFSIKILKQQGRTKKEILNILNNRNKPRFIKYEKKYEVLGLNKKKLDIKDILEKVPDDIKRTIESIFPKSEVKNAILVDYFESGFDTNAIRKYYKNPGGGNDLGLFQINDKYHPEVRKYNWRNPEINIKLAYSIYKEAGNSWKPWHAAIKIGLA